MQKKQKKEGLGKKASRFEERKKGKQKKDQRRKLSEGVHRGEASCVLKKKERQTTIEKAGEEGLSGFS